MTQNRPWKTVETSKINKYYFIYLTGQFRSGCLDYELLQERERTLRKRASRRKPTALQDLTEYNYCQIQPQDYIYSDKLEVYYLRKWLELKHDLTGMVEAYLPEETFI